MAAVVTSLVFLFVGSLGCSWGAVHLSSERRNSAVRAFVVGMLGALLVGVAIGQLASLIFGW